MAHRYHFRGGNNSTIIAVADADFYSEEMSENYERRYWFIRFYSDAAATTPVEPSAGTITFTGSADYTEDTADRRYLTIDNGSFAATTTDDADRLIPTASGPMLSSKLNLSGIVGATHFRAWIVGY